MKTLALRKLQICDCPACRQEARAIVAQREPARRERAHNLRRIALNALITLAACAAFVVVGTYALGWVLSVAPTMQ